jgi:hypothetical protein
MVLIDCKRVRVAVLIDLLTTAYVRGGKKLLFEVNVHGLIERPEATAADLWFDQAKVGSHQNACLCPKQLHGAHDFFRLAPFDLD